MFTANGAKSLASCQPGSAKERIGGRVGFFFKATRGLPQIDFERLLSQAWDEDALDTLKLIFHLRNCRGGKGERELFRNACRWLQATGRGCHLTPNLDLVASMGRWDDLMSCGRAGFEHLAAQLLEDFFKAQADDEKGRKATLSLAAKWATRPAKNPRQARRALESKQTIQALNAVLARSPDLAPFGVRKVREAEYRKLLSVCTRRLGLLERLMCEGKWDQINFNLVPSCAMRLYGKNEMTKVRAPGSFMRRQPTRFQEWREALKDGKTEDGRKVKVNAKQLFVHSLAAEYLLFRKALDPVVEAQWAELVRLARSKGKFQALCCPDVSGSMQTQTHNSSRSRCLDVSVALGVFCAEVATGPFHNMLITFDRTPKVHMLRDGTTLFSKVRSVANMEWGMSTNVLGVFRLILQTAQENKVPESEMPKMVIIPSDMQFNSCGGAKTNFERIDQMYREAGFVRPTLVFWNLAAGFSDYPVTADEKGTVLMSGFSVSLLKSLIECPENVTPWGIVRKTVLENAAYQSVALGKETD